MRQTPDINPNIRKAQQDVDRFEASKKSLVPEFELPKDEESERRYSEETLMADFITERIESKEARELINDPILIKTAYQDFLSYAKEGKKGDTTSAAWALRTSSALLATDTLHLLAPEEEKELQRYLNDPILIKTAYQRFLSDAKRGKEGNTTNTALALWTFSALTTVRNYLREKGKKIDDTNAANEELNSEKEIPERPRRKMF